MNNNHIGRIEALQGLRARDISTIQVNLGLRCNQQCSHCHLEAGPDDDRIMSETTMDLILDVLRGYRADTLDVTGGAPELHPHFRRFVEQARPLVPRLIDRCNLTVLMLPDQQDTPEFLRHHKAEIVASLPCYTRENVDAVRGPGVFETSIAALKKLNQLGYGSDPDLVLNLMYNPGGPFLPASAEELEADYRRELDSNHGVRFNRLLTMANSPIGRFGEALHKAGDHDEYIGCLAGSFNAETVPQLMCRHMVSVGWDGRLYDCDFNLALSLPVNHGAPDHISVFDAEALSCRRIVTGEHCLACTAGAGSSCGGELAPQ